MYMATETELIWQRGATVSKHTGAFSPPAPESAAVKSPELKLGVVTDELLNLGLLPEPARVRAVHSLS